MQAAKKLPVINKEEVIPLGGDYQALLQEGLEKISEYSGELWNNYNLSDPGVTILQSLCYALTELNYKAHLPIEDILTGRDGKICYQDRFVMPEDILPVNPVTLQDFKKLLLDQVPALKQVYFNLDSHDRIFNTYRPFLEIKPAYLEYLNRNQDFVIELNTSVTLLLRDHSNLGQLFFEPRLLSSPGWQLEGEIHLNAAANSEEFAARLLYLLNNYLSPYPQYQSYDALLAAGNSNGQIFNGPLCRSGFLPEDNFPDKRPYFSLDEVITLINTMEDVQSVGELQLKGQKITQQDGERKVEIPLLAAPYFSVDDLVDGLAELVMLQNGRSINRLSKNKVQYELTKLIPQPQSLPDLGDYLPEGNYRDIRQYYSIQHHFPEAYQLGLTKFKKNQDPFRVAKIKQLKAYLALPEQIMANFLAQLDGVGDLFSFESGRNLYQLAGNTYYFQDLYDVPGIQELLRDVKGYAKQANDRSREQDWKAYRRDYLNPYRQQLMAASESSDINLDRKSRALKHLLARFGSRYQADYLRLNNPKYGDDRTAEVVHISRTLKQFALLSANRSRTYFYHEDHPEVASTGFRYGTEMTSSQLRERNLKSLIFPEILLSGFELSAKNELCLGNYYQGLDETIRQALQIAPDSLSVLYYGQDKISLLFGQEVEKPKHVAPVPGIEIYHNQELLVDFSYRSIPLKWTKEKVEDELYPYLQALCELGESGAGFVFIDQIRLLEDLFFHLEIMDETATTTLHKSQLMTLAQIEGILTKLQNGANPRLVEKEHSWSIEFPFGKEFQPFCEIADGALAEKVHQQLLAFQPASNKTIQLWGYNEHFKSVKLTPEWFESRLSVLYPQWVTLLNTSAYQQFFQEKLLAATPLGIRLDSYPVPQEKMQLYLKGFKTWMTGRALQKQQMQLECQGKSLPPEALNAITQGKLAAWDILFNLLIDQDENN